MRLVIAPLAALLAMASGLACGDDDGSSADPSALQGLPWVLVSGLDVEGWEETAPSATFEEGRLAGSTGCNQFTASYTLAGDALEIGPIASTRMACTPPADSVERDYVAALEQVRAWQVENGELMLVDADETEVLRYEVATPSGSWQATGFLQGGAIKSLIAGTEITASFDAGTLSGAAGCNTYRAAYTTERGGIEITQLAATEKACALPAGIMEQEAAYLAAVPTARLQLQVGDAGLHLAQQGCEIGVVHLNRGRDEPDVVVADHPPEPARPDALAEPLDTDIGRDLEDDRLAQLSSYVFHTDRLPVPRSRPLDPAGSILSSRRAARRGRPQPPRGVRSRPPRGGGGGCGCGRSPGSGAALPRSERSTDRARAAEEPPPGGV